VIALWADVRVGEQRLPIWRAAEQPEHSRYDAADLALHERCFRSMDELTSSTA
jgi:hypothetical protein